MVVNFKTQNKLHTQYEIVSGKKISTEREQNIHSIKFIFLRIASL